MITLGWDWAGRCAGRLRSCPHLSRLLTKPTKLLYAQRRFRSAWAFAQSDQSLHWALSGVAKGPSFLHADSEDSDQTGRMPRLIWVFAGRTAIMLVLSWSGSFCCFRVHYFSCWCQSQRRTAIIDWGTPGDVFEPAHEIMVLSVLHKLIFQTRMRGHPVGLDVWLLVGPFVYFHTWCVRTAKALARLRACAGSPEPSLVAYVISIKISWARSFNCFLVTILGLVLRS